LKIMKGEPAGIREIIASRRRSEMTTRLFAAAVVAFVGVVLISSVAWAQLPPAATLVPAGFTLEGERNLGGSMVISARKPNETFPRPHMDQGIILEIIWMNQPAAEQILEMVASQPEEPGERLAGSATRVDPCGKERYRGGVLSCQKSTTPWIGSGSGPDLVTMKIGWTGLGPTGLVSVGVTNFYGKKEAAMAWIDAIIPKIVKGK
jgi:hypothetical protein